MLTSILGNLNLDEVAESARQTQLIANLKALDFKSMEENSDTASLRAIVYRLGRLDDPNVIGTVLLGYNHFLQELGPLFQKYIANLVSTTTSAEDLWDKISQLVAQHDHLFDCQVKPGFAIQDATGEIPRLNAWVAQIIVPVAAASLRDIELLNAVSEKIGLPDLIKSFRTWFRKRQHDSQDMRLVRRGSWDDNITTTADFFMALGYTPPLLPTLKTRFVNWKEPSLRSSNSGPTEFSSLSRRSTDPMTVKRTLDNTSITLISANSSSPNEGPLDDLVAFIGLMPSSTQKANISLIPSVNQSVVIVGPMLLIWPNNIELMPLRHFQVSSGNGTSFSSTGTATDEFTSLTPGQSATAAAVNASTFSGLATTQSLKPANRESSSLFYRQASLSVTVNLSIFFGQGRNRTTSLVIVDLLSGTPLSTTTTTTVSSDPTDDAETVILHAELKPGAGGGMWEGGFNGGGVYGVGILDGDGTLVRSLLGDSGNSSSSNATVVGGGGGGGGGKSTSSTSTSSSSSSSSSSTSSSPSSSQITSAADTLRPRSVSSLLLVVMMGVGVLGRCIHRNP